MAITREMIEGMTQLVLGGAVGVTVVAMGMRLVTGRWAPFGWWILVVLCVASVVPLFVVWRTLPPKMASAPPSRGTTMSGSRVCGNTVNGVPVGYPCPAGEK